MQRLARYARGAVELHITPCVVTMPPACDRLCVPSNERLVGTQFAHFPVGGPTPVAERIGEAALPDRYREASRMLYQCESVDGAVTEFGGAAQEAATLAHAPVVGGTEAHPVRCPTGAAVLVPSAGAFARVFRRGLVLAVPPFWPGAPTDAWRRDLGAAYGSAFDLGCDGGAALATPLMGAGARGAPLVDAADAAADAAAAFVEHGARTSDARVLFAVLDDDVADVLDAALSRALRRR